jgi:hypothetical protein
MVTSPPPFAEPSERVAIVDCTVIVRSLPDAPAEDSVTELWPAVFVQGDDLRVEGCLVEAAQSKLTGGLGGIQVGGLTKRADVIDCTVRGGNGHGITLGSIVWVPRARLPDAVGDYEGFVAMVLMLGWLVWFDGGCIVIGGNPIPEDDDPDQELVPVSVGTLEDIAIEGNDIALMAGDGIGVARFFEPADDEEAEIITVERLRIDRNRIIGNRRTAPAEGSPALTRLSGAGGIALADVTDLRVRDNRVVANGRSELVPLCGVFVLSGAALLFTGNDIADNGADPDRESVPRIGNRGGIVVRACRSASVGTVRASQTPEIGAVLIHDNRVAQPAGQAIWVMGIGQMSIHDNQLSAGNLATVDIFSAALRMLEGGFDGFGDIAAVALAHFVGLSVTMINLGLPIDILNLREKGAIAGGLTGAGNLMQIGRALDSDVGAEAFEEASASEAAVGEPVQGIDDFRSSSSAIGRLLHGGHVSFNDNQVTLALIDAQLSLALCSILLVSLDDVAMHDNQVRCLTFGDLVLVDAVAGSLWTTRCQGNRLQELAGGRAIGARAGFGTLRSLFTWALMNTTTGNQMSRPYTAGTFSGLLVDEHNLNLP